MIIKAGTYRFNDEPVFPDAGLGQEIGFTVSIVDGDITYIETCNGFQINWNNDEDIAMFVVAIEPVIEGVVLPALEPLYSGGWLYDTQTITIPTDSEVSSEFYEWFTANAVEQKQISGKWKFNDVLSMPSARIDQRINFTSTFTEEGVSYLASCEEVQIGKRNDGSSLVVYIANAIDPVVDGISFPFELEGYVDAWLAESLQTTDYGTTPQYVSAEFYDWFTANAKPESDKTPIASIHYNGSTIASLFGGQTATVKLKGDGVQVVPDIVVEVAEQTKAEVVEDYDGTITIE